MNYTIKSKVIVESVTLELTPEALNTISLLVGHTARNTFLEYANSEYNEDKISEKDLLSTEQFSKLFATLEKIRKEIEN